MLSYVWVLVAAIFIGFRCLRLRLGRLLLAGLLLAPLSESLLLCAGDGGSGGGAVGLLLGWSSCSSLFGWLVILVVGVDHLRGLRLG